MDRPRSRLSLLRLRESKRVLPLTTNYEDDLTPPAARAALHQLAAHAPGMPDSHTPTSTTGVDGVEPAVRVLGDATNKRTTNAGGGWCVAGPTPDALCGQCSDR